MEKTYFEISKLKNWEKNPRGIRQGIEERRARGELHPTIVAKMEAARKKGESLGNVR